MRMSGARTGILGALCAGLLVAGLAVGCDKPAATKAPEADAGPAPLFNKSNQLKEFMGHAIDPIVWRIWRNQGWVYSDKVEELFPTTQEGWDDVTNAGFQLAELANALMIPGRAPGNDKATWDKYAASLYTTSMCLHEAAEKKDKELSFEMGGKIYEACTGCHAKFLIGDDNPPPAPDCSVDTSLPKRQ